MLFLALFAAAAGQPAPAAPVPAALAEERENRFRSLFVDWRATAHEALKNEQARVRGGGLVEPPPERQARALGDQVGEMVALGDCDGGERLARDAGDLALVGAVQDHCRRQVGAILAQSRAATPD